MVHQCLVMVVEVADVKGGELILSDGHVLGKGSLGLPGREQMLGYPAEVSDQEPPWQSQLMACRLIPAMYKV